MHPYVFDPVEQKARLVNWIREWFSQNGPTCNAVLGISGGKDSSIAAALCVEAIGRDRVIGVLMPNGEQSDIDDSYKLVNSLGIRYVNVNIAEAVQGVLNNIGSVSVPDTGTNAQFDITEQTKNNLPPRIRMATLYAISQSMNGRVVNTCNLSETMIGWETRWGDAVGDFAPLADLTVTEVIAIGLLCDIPRELVIKTPSDGLCGKTDEDAIGFTYAALDRYLRTGVAEPWLKAMMDDRIVSSRFKRREIPKYISNLYNYSN